MSNCNTQIKQLYILTFINSEENTSKCEISASYDPIATPTNPPYALLHIIPTSDGQDVQTITGQYVYGTGNNQVYNFTETNAYINPILNSETCRGNTLLEKLQFDFLSRSPDQICQILQQSIYPGDEDDRGIQQYVNTFVGGVALTLLTYRVATLDQNDVGRPFAPFDPCSPLEIVCLTDLTQSLYNYYSYLIRFLQCVPLCVIGKIWFEQVQITWDFWGNCFFEGPPYNDNEAIYCTIQGYACYFEQAALAICAKINEIEQKLAQALEQIKTEIEDALQLIEEKIHKFDKRFDKALSTIICVSMMLMDALKERYCTYKQNLDQQYQINADRLAQKYGKHQQDLTNIKDQLLAQSQAIAEQNETKMLNNFQLQQSELNSLVQQTNEELIAHHRERMTEMKKYVKAHNRLLEDNRVNHERVLDKYHDQLSSNLKQEYNQYEIDLGQSYQSIVSNLRQRQKEHLKQVEIKIEQDYVKNVIDNFLASDEFSNMVDRMVKERVEVVIQSKYRQFESDE